MQNDDIFYEALLKKDGSFEGTFIVGVKTTGIFCRPTCSARKPKRDNVEFFSSTKEAILKGYRACKICKPMQDVLSTPSFVTDILKKLDENQNTKIKDFDLRAMGIDPTQIRRWFLKNHGMTFHAYQRMQRINHAFKNYQTSQNVSDTAFATGYQSLSGFNSAFKNIIGATPQNSQHIQIINLTRFETILGTMIACATEKGICLLEFTDRKMLEAELKQLATNKHTQIIPSDNMFFAPLKEQLNAYFKGKLKIFDLPLDIKGSEFQKTVWNGLLKIPYGTVTSYGKQALDLNMPKAVRAVARANGMNKISIIIPCHRVIGSNGSLTGYGGGLWRKKKLLETENSYTTNMEMPF